MITYKELEKSIGRAVRVQTKRYGFSYMNKATYIVTGISKEIIVNADGIVRAVLKVKVSAELQSKSSVWLAADEVSLI